MRVEAARLRQRGVEAALPEADEPGAAKLEAARHHLDVALLQGVVDDVFVLLHHHAAGGVDLCGSSGGGDGRGGRSAVSVRAAAPG